MLTPTICLALSKVDSEGRTVLQCAAVDYRTDFFKALLSRCKELGILEQQLLPTCAPELSVLTTVRRRGEAQQQLFYNSTQSSCRQMLFYL